MKGVDGERVICERPKREERPLAESRTGGTAGEVHPMSCAREIAQRAFRVKEEGAVWPLQEGASAPIRVEPRAYSSLKEYGYAFIFYLRFFI